MHIISVQYGSILTSCGNNSGFRLVGVGSLLVLVGGILIGDYDQSFFFFLCFYTQLL